MVGCGRQQAGRTTEERGVKKVWLRDLFPKGVCPLSTQRKTPKLNSLRIRRARTPAARRPTGACGPRSPAARGRRPEPARAAVAAARTHRRRRSAPQPAAPIRPGPQSARAPLSGGPGAARGALRPLAPRQGARHPPATAPRAACPLFWSRGPAQLPSVASERGSGQSARLSAPSPPPPRPYRAHPPRALRATGPARSHQAGWGWVHVPRGAPHSHWLAGRARPRSQPVKAEVPGTGPRAGLGAGRAQRGVPHAGAGWPGDGALPGQPASPV